jgi:hypothetical protein
MPPPALKKVERVREAFQHSREGANVTPMK